MASSFLSSSKAASTSRIVSRLNAFRFSGRLMVIFATAPRFSIRIYFLSAAMNESFLRNDMQNTSFSHFFHAGGFEQLLPETFPFCAFALLKKHALSRVEGRR